MRKILFKILSFIGLVAVIAVGTMSIIGSGSADNDKDFVGLWKVYYMEGCQVSMMCGHIDLYEAPVVCDGVTYTVYFRLKNSTVTTYLKLDDDETSEVYYCPAESISSTGTIITVNTDEGPLPIAYNIDAENVMHFNFDMAVNFNIDIEMESAEESEIIGAVENCDEADAIDFYMDYLADDCPVPG